MFFLHAFLFVLAAARWGDWENWRLYYPTILFLIIGDLLYNFLLFDYPMWMFEDKMIGQSIFFDHTIVVLIHLFIIYPATILIYLGNFPKKFGNQVLWMGLWVGIYMCKEFISHAFGFITHHNGWNDWWSVAFDVVMFSLIAIHHKRPLLALIVSAIWIVVLWNLHQVPISILK